MKATIKFSVDIFVLFFTLESPTWKQFKLHSESSIEQWWKNNTFSYSWYPCFIRTKNGERQNDVNQEMFPYFKLFISLVAWLCINCSLFNFLNGPPNFLTNITIIKNSFNFHLFTHLLPHISTLILVAIHWR